MRRLAALALLAPLPVGCGGASTMGVRDEGAAAAGATAAVSPGAATGAAGAVPTSPAPGTAFVYLLRYDQPAPVRRAVPIDLPVPEGSLRALVSGPTQAERVLGYSSALPEGTRVLAFSLANRVAIADLSAMPSPDDDGQQEALLALYQVVYTLTGTEGVDAVRVRVRGRPYGLNALTGSSSADEPPLTRTDLSFVPDATSASGSVGCDVAKKAGKGVPEIAVSRPRSGQVVKGVIEIRGTIAGPGGPVVLRLLQNQLEVANRIIDERCRGAFSATLPVPRGLAGEVELVAIAPGADGAETVSATQTFAVGE